MKNFRILKYSAQLASMFVYMFASYDAAAIGLGEVDVMSHLGEPLRAKINVHGINSLSDESCFKLTKSNEGEDYLKYANFKLTNLIDGEALLLVSSNQVIDDPVLNLSITTQCENVVKRDYVLLLDPLLTNEAEVINSPTMLGKSAATQVMSSKSKRLASIQSEINNSVTSANSTSSSGKVSKTKNKRQQTAQNSSILPSTSSRVRKLNDDVSANSMNQPNKTVKPLPVIKKSFSSKQLNKSELVIADKPTTNLPRLTISSGGMSDRAVPAGSLALRLDAQLHFTPNNDPRAFAAEAEVQDEVTVMNNRLAHLEKQLTTLQKRNLLLETDSKLHLQEVEDTKMQSNLWRWATYLLGAALLAGSIFAADWWRKRQLHLKMDSDANWTYVDEKLINEHSDKSNLYTTTEEQQQDSFINDIGTFTSIDESNKDREFKSSLSTEEFDFTPVKPAFMASKVESVVVEEDILDHADVFLSHGRSGLAIQLLQNHLLDYPDRSMTVWLFLLDLLAKEGQEEEYKAAAIECKKYFNVELPDYALPLPQNSQGIESFNVLTSHLTNVWQTEEAVTFLDGLIYNNRLQPRSGFNHGTFEELALLKGIAQEHEQTAEIIPLFQKVPTIKSPAKSKESAKKLAAVKLEIQKTELTQTLAANESMEMPPILLDLDTTESSKETKEKTEEPDFGFNLVEWK